MLTDSSQSRRKEGPAAQLDQRYSEQLWVHVASHNNNYLLVPLFYLIMHFKPIIFTAFATRLSMVHGISAGLLIMSPLVLRVCVLASLRLTKPLPLLVSSG